MNKRSEIVDAVALRLESIPVTIDSLSIPIYKNRYSPIQSMPAISVYGLGDNGEKSADESGYKRIERIRIMIYLSGLEDIDSETGGSAFDVLDDIFSQIENDLFKAKETLGILYRFNYVSTEITPDRRGDDLILVGSLNFEAVYYDYL